MVVDQLADLELVAAHVEPMGAVRGLEVNMTHGVLRVHTPRVEVVRAVALSGSFLELGAGSFAHIGRRRGPIQALATRSAME